MRAQRSLIDRLAWSHYRDVRPALSLTKTVRRCLRFSGMERDEGSAPSIPVWKTGVYLSTLIPQKSSRSLNELVLHLPPSLLDLKFGCPGPCVKRGPFRRTFAQVSKLPLRIEIRKLDR